METYWDAYLNEVGNDVKFLTMTEMMRGFYEYLEKKGKIMTAEAAEGVRERERAKLSKPHGDCQHPRLVWKSENGTFTCQLCKDLASV